MKLTQDVLAVLSEAKTNANTLILVGQLDRKLYQAVNKALEAAGGKWNRKEKAHVFETNASDRVDQMILTGEVEIPKDEFNFFPSPPAVVEKLMELAQLQQGMQVLEPSAGQGAIAEACKTAGCLVDCVELMTSNVEHLKTKGYNSVIESNFLDIPFDPVYDRVIMNPPFLKQADIRHVNHALGFLKPDGLLIAVMSAGVKFRENQLTKDFRALVAARGGEIHDLPEQSFKTSGTNVHTVVVTIPA
jgi:predicted RNA methylase